MRTRSVAFYSAIAHPAPQSWACAHHYLLSYQVLDGSATLSSVAYWARVMSLRGRQVALENKWSLLFSQRKICRAVENVPGRLLEAGLLRSILSELLLNLAGG